MTAHEHWQRIYQTKSAGNVSWYTPHLGESLRLIREVAPPEARIIDVGAGASTLVDDLILLGYRRLTLLDVSDAALELSRGRLGEMAGLVTWIAADVTTCALARDAFDVWHDRAVFHFLTAASDRRAYVENVRRSVVPGGRVVIATFAPSGPTHCSGLEVVRYDAPLLSRELGSDFDLDTELEATHTTPAGHEQRFLFCRFRKRALE